MAIRHALRARIGACAGLALVTILWQAAPVEALGGAALGLRSAQHSCRGLPGAAFAVCHAYCDAVRCDRHPQRSCDVLRMVFGRLTGSNVLPCDARGFCGDGVVQAAEECDPAGTVCDDGQPCNADCSCPPPSCGNGEIDAGEECDPAAVPCASGVLCAADCTCPDPVCGNGSVEGTEDCDPPGSPCMPGGVCSSDCTCRGSDPQCQGATCLLFSECNPGSACGLPICATTAEGGGVCIEGETDCSRLSPCASSADCPPGGVCVVDTCCDGGVCIGSGGFCPQP